jgi:hypothetical protein
MPSVRCNSGIGGIAEIFGAGVADALSSATNAQSSAGSDHRDAVSHR